MWVSKKIEMRKLKYGCGLVTQNFLLNYFLFKITINLSKKVEFSSEKQKDMADDGTLVFKNCRFQKLVATVASSPQPEYSPFSVLFYSAYT